MANDIITNLHPDNDPSTNLYPNIKKENIPSKSISTDKLDDNVLSLIGSLKPSGTDTSTNILAFTSNKGIYVATDNGHWYYWNGSAYADGGVYQAVEIANGSVLYNKLSQDVKNSLKSFYIKEIKRNKLSSDCLKKIALKSYDITVSSNTYEVYGIKILFSENINSNIKISFDLINNNNTEITIYDYNVQNKLINYDLIPSNMSLEFNIIPNSNGLFIRFKSVVYPCNTIIKDIIIMDVNDNNISFTSDNIVLFGKGTCIENLTTYDEITTTVSENSILRKNLNDDCFNDIINKSYNIECSTSPHDIYGFKIKFENNVSGNINLKALMSNINNVNEFTIYDYSISKRFYDGIVNDNIDISFNVDNIEGVFFRVKNTSKIFPSSFTLNNLHFFNNNIEIEYTTDNYITFGTGTVSESIDVIPKVLNGSNVYNLKNNNILFFGDSITKTSGRNTFPYYVAKLCNATEINYGQGGSGFSGSAPTVPNSSIIDKIIESHNDNVQCDVIVVAGGTNDWDFGRDYGTFNDIFNDTMNNPSFYFNVAKSIKLLMEYYPLKQYLYVIPIPRNQPNGSGNQHTPNSITQKTLVDYCNAIKEVCNYFSIPYLDMINISNMHLENEIARNMYTLDGLHPTDYYNEHIYAPLVANALKKLKL